MHKNFLSRRCIHYFKVIIKFKSSTIMLQKKYIPALCFNLIFMTLFPPMKIFHILSFVVCLSSDGYSGDSNGISVDHPRGWLEYKYPFLSLEFPIIST